MSEWLDRAFSGGVSLARVNPIGIALMLLAVAIVVAAKPVSVRFPEARRAGACNAIKLAGLLVCAVGVFVAIEF